MAKARKLGVKIQFNTKVVELLTDENTGAVTGVRARSKKGTELIKGKLGVVLTGEKASVQQAEEYLKENGVYVEELKNGLH